ncbi:MAG: D-glucuronyl C5-epimerase family protein, partial [Gemmatimonadota bacterium]
SALYLFATARVKADSFQLLGSPPNLGKGASISRALGLVTGFYSRNLFADSARFHRVMDIVSVSIEIATDQLPVVLGRSRPAATPFLLWYSYAWIGAFFQPVTTAQTVAHLLPRESAPTDSVLAIAEKLYTYSLWREHEGKRFPVWEYEFTWTSGGITVTSPWISAMAQGLVMSVFTECYRRTGDPLWRARAFEVFNSFTTSWSDGGVRLDDTTHGYWWEEFHPVVKVWNGSVQALIDVGFLASVTGDLEVQRMFERGMESIKYYTHEYDTGTWTLYSKTQGYNSVAYHNFQIALLDKLATLTPDPWVQETSDRWRAYIPPAGVH